MAVLDDKKKLGPNDYVSFRVVEDRDNESQRLRVNDNGELEVPYIGLVPAQGHTCKELAYSIKSALEKEYYYHATVILAVDRVSEKSRGRIYVYGSVKGQGPQEIPADETYTVSKAVIRAGGFGDFANKRKVKVTRKNGQDFVVDLKRVIEEGHTEDDVVLAAGRSNLRSAAFDQHVSYASSCSRKTDRSVLVHGLHHAPASLQSVAFTTLVDSGFDHLPGFICRSVAPFPNAALVPFREQDDARRQIEYQPGRGL